MNRPDGYRYVRSYHAGVKSGRPYWNRWALYEVRDGKAQRVGTAHNEKEYQAFIAEND